MPAEAKSKAHASRADQQSGAPGQNNTDPGEKSLLDFVTDLIVLARQTWLDRFALAKAEAQLAFGSLLLLLGLVLALAVTLILVWVLVMVALAYYALQWGLNGGWVVAGLLVAQLLLAWYLLRKIKQVTTWLSFPETRRSLASLSEPKAPPAASDEAADSGQHQGGTSR